MLPLFLCTLLVPSVLVVVYLAVGSWVADRLWRRRVRRLPKCEVIDFAAHRNAGARVRVAAGRTTRRYPR